ncbi:DUF1642 domain-containing protein [Streptococcus mitis]|uniref:DUF1642 domain-containing protein n=1 Tax=Streptococcus mitis TaxID=28037 RepID=UPI0021B7D2AE|nr:DUF1642 domain-containing protein [Streptococcus mitis]
MNKQELIKAVEELPANCRGLRPMIDKWSTLELIKLLDEPQPVKVPQFVADVIERAREESPELEDALQYTWGNGTKEFTEWYNKKSNRDLFARAWLDGYEVDEEKRYEVILRNGQSLKTVYRQGGDHLDFEMVYGDLESFTRKRLEEAGFGWVFDCPGIEIEEVEV